MTSPNLIITTDPSCADLALEELRRVCPGAAAVARPEPGVLVCAADSGFGDIAAKWQAGPPVFTRHICPVDTTVAVSGAADVDLAALEKACREMCAGRLAGNLSFSVQTRTFGAVALKPFDVNTRLATAITELSGASLDVRNPSQVVSVVLAGSKGWLGLSTAEQNLSNWAGGARRFAREDGQLSRSEFKLLEALEVFKLSLPKSGTALDLGAAPGGWTRVLRRAGLQVTAVDPAELDQSLAADPGVRHERTTAERYLQGSHPTRFDCIVNDMRQDARDSARTMVRYAPLLAPEGVALMTCKLPHAGRLPTLEQALAILAAGYRGAGARHLFHNRSEVTVCLRPGTGGTDTGAQRSPS